jgi:hypothetical protein
MKKKGEFKAQQERHRKRQTLWDGVKAVREGRQAVLEVSGRSIFIRPFDFEEIGNLSESCDIYYLIQVKAKSLVVARLIRRDGPKVGDILLGHARWLGYHIKPEAIIGYCAIPKVSCV